MGQFSADRNRREGRTATTCYLYVTITDTEFISQQLQMWRESYPKAGVMALVAEQELQHIPQLQILCNRAGMPLLGALFPEIYLSGRFYRTGVLLILLDPMVDFYRMIEFDSTGGDSMLQVSALAEQIKEQISDDEPMTLLMLFDALVPNISSILETLYLHLAESVHYAGANAGSETFQSVPCLFDNERLIENGLLTLLFRGHEGAVLEHGYQAPDRLIAATATEGNRIISIGWKPAFDVYRDHIKELYGVEITRDNFFDNAVHFPFGILRGDDEVLVRIPVVQEPDGSLFCLGEVPDHTVLTLLEAPAPSSLKTPQLLAERMHRTSQTVFCFYCAGRRVHLGSEVANKELVRLQQVLSCSELFGALSLGEIGSSQRGGYPLFHHASLVCMNL
jgi:hypothetical protein